MRIRPWAAAATAVVATLLSACGDDGGAVGPAGAARAPVEAGVSAPDPAALDLSDLGVVIEDGDGNSTRLGSGLPDDLPSQVVVPRGYTTMTASTQELEGRTSFTIVGLATADTATVAAELEAAYDATPERLEVGDVTDLEFHDVDGVDISYTIQDNADGVAVVTIGVYPRLD